MQGWPVEPGEYEVGDPASPVAISALSDEELLEALRRSLNKSLYAIMGVTRTPNIGVEKLIRNIAANPSIRYLVLAGRDSEPRAVAPVILALHQYGVDERMRVIGVGQKVELRNLTREEVEEFRRRVKVIDMSGVTEAGEVVRLVEGLAPQSNAPSREPGASQVPGYARVQAEDDDEVILDERGFFIIYVDKERGRIVCEHYENSGRKTAEIIGSSARAIYKAAIRMGLISRLDHAAYLGRELARAECALRLGEKYVQDRA